MKQLGNSSFYNSHIGNVVIPDGITEIPNHTFDGCTNMKEITIPVTIQSINNTLIPEAPIIKTWHNSYPKEWAIQNNRMIHYMDEITPTPLPDPVNIIHLPSKLTTIGDSAFEGCNSFDTITIPNAVETIGDKAIEPNIVINTWRNTYAEEWSLSNNRPIRYLDEDTPQP
ncbi:MAG: leucine-rich repeat domain-containing protein [Anaerolineaceae bacterium]|nr:leucine-rich repeat domain-containing protein [Anaerolineaceae bacterium]